MQVTFGVNYNKRPSASQIRDKQLQHCLPRETIDRNAFTQAVRIDSVVGLSYHSLCYYCQQQQYKITN